MCLPFERDFPFSFALSGHAALVPVFDSYNGFVFTSFDKCLPISTLCLRLFCMYELLANAYVLWYRVYKCDVVFLYF